MKKFFLILLSLPFILFLLTSVNAIQFEDYPTKIKSISGSNITDAQLLKYGDYWYLLWAKNSTTYGSYWYIEKFDESWTSISSVLLNRTRCSGTNIFYVDCRMRIYDNTTDEIIDIYCYGMRSNKVFHRETFNLTLDQLDDRIWGCAGSHQESIPHHVAESEEGRAYTDGKMRTFVIGNTSITNMTMFWEWNATDPDNNYKDIEDPTDITRYIAWDVVQDYADNDNSRICVVYVGDVNTGDNAGKRYIYMNIYDRDLDFIERKTLLEVEETGSFVEPLEKNSSYFTTGTRFDTTYFANAIDIAWLKRDSIRRLAVDTLGNNITLDYLYNTSGDKLNLTTNFTDYFNIRSFQFEHAGSEMILLIVGTENYTTPSAVYLYEQNYTWCYCGDWVIDMTCGDSGTEKCCVGEQVRLKRDCSPDGCDEEYDFQNDTDCFYQDQGYYPQNYSIFCEEHCCYGDSVNLKGSEPGRTSQCSIEFHIPANTSLSSNNATAIMFPEVTWGFRGLTDFSNIANWQWESMVCIPRTECEQDTRNCFLHEINQTINKTIRDITPDSHVHAHFSMQKVHCSHDTIVSWWHGWESFRVHGCVYYCYEYACGDRRVCVMDEGGNWLSVAELKNCELNYTDYIVCTEGCHQESGLCYEDWKETTEGAKETRREPSGNLFDWIKGEAEYNFPTYVLNVISIGVSAGGGVYATMYTKYWQMGAIASMGFVLLFMNFGWLPAIIGVLWILALVTLMMKGLFFKGGN